MRSKPNELPSLIPKTGTETEQNSSQKTNPNKIKMTTFREEKSDNSFCTSIEFTPFGKAIRSQGTAKGV